ncbi:MAG TPA: class I SAM-dependent methyltransferase [Acidimicrobiales bacterium]|jgi:demethylmenaquinone methyltransferase/2-methoxy-6-polyprenyl-1,4-benzoquinol methylase|nr:class I SAM-dependent methyltransferase [Acidimicrobiales bacterium]
MTSDVLASRTEPNAFARRLFQGLPRRYNLLAEVLSLGQDRRWHDEMITHVASAAPRRILDVACGPAAVTCALAAATPASIVGIDLSHDMLGQGAVNVARHGLTERVSLVLGRGEQLPFGDGAFDALTCTYLLRYVADPAATIAELARVVRPGGAIASLEFAVPPRRFWRAWWWGYTRLVLPVAGLVTGGRAWYDVGRFLGPSISRHYEAYPVPWTLDAWQRAGIERIGHRRMSLGGGLVIWGTRS